MAGCAAVAGGKVGMDGRGGGRGLEIDLVHLESWKDSEKILRL